MEGAVIEEENGEGVSYAVRMRVELFQNLYVQQALRRFWDVLAKDGQLGMEDFVNFNVRLQKVLVPDFKYDAAIESAVTDWHEDFGAAMHADFEKLGIFLFELSQLWAAKTLQSVLLFLSAAFLAVTKAEGARSVGLLPLESCAVLPNVLFELLDAEAPPAVTDEASLEAWSIANFTPEADTAVAVQRTAFRVLHDIRAVRLFELPVPEVERTRRPPPSVPLMPALVDAQVLQRSVPARPGGRPARGPALPTGWVAKSAAPKAKPSEPRVQPLMVQASRAGPPARSSLAESASKSLTRPHEQPRFVTVRRTEGLLADQGLYVSKGSEELAGDTVFSGMDSLELQAGAQFQAGRGDADKARKHDASLSAEHTVSTEPSALLQSFSAPLDAPDLAAIAEQLRDEAPAYGAGAVDLGLQASYALPLRRAALHQERVALQFIAPGDVAYKAAKNFQLEAKPFDKRLARLPGQSERGPAHGPFGSGADPVFGVMARRLAQILKKGEKRSARRRRKKMRWRPSRNDEGRDLRQYLDAKASDFQAEEHDRLHEKTRAPRPSEFLDQVEEHEFRTQERTAELESMFAVRGMHSKSAA